MYKDRISSTPTTLRQKVKMLFTALIVVLVCFLLGQKALHFQVKVDDELRHMPKLVVLLPGDGCDDDSWCSYKVKPGDSYNKLEKIFKTPAYKIREQNGLTANWVLQPGQELVFKKYTFKPHNGWASFYGDQGGLFHGKPMANGETYNQNDFVAAHRHLPFGIKLRVTNLLNGKSVIVTVKDRGPYVDTDKRQIDLSVAAAKVIGMYERGIAPVRIEQIDEPIKI